jgi:hypothetical protein
MEDKPFQVKKDIGFKLPKLNWEASTNYGKSSITGAVREKE